MWQIDQTTHWTFPRQIQTWFWWVQVYCGCSRASALCLSQVFYVKLPVSFSYISILCFCYIVYSKCLIIHNNHHNLDLWGDKRKSDKSWQHRQNQLPFCSQCLIFYHYLFISFINSVGKVLCALLQHNVSIHPHTTIRLCNQFYII